MRFLVLLVSAFIAAAPACAQTLEARLVSTFKEFCIPPASWEEMPAHGEKVAREKGWQHNPPPDPTKDTSYHGILFAEHLIRNAWTFSDPDTKFAGASFSYIGPTLPGVRYNTCAITIQVEQIDRESLLAIRKLIAAEVDRQFGDSVVRRDPKRPPFWEGADQWHFTYPGKDEQDCARMIVSPPAYYGPGVITLYLAEISSPGKPDLFHMTSRCYYTREDKQRYDREQKQKQ